MQQLKTVVAPWQAGAQKFDTDYTQAVNNRNVPAVIQSINAFTGTNDAFASSLKGLQPPVNAKSQQDQLVSGVQQLSSDLTQLKTAFNQRDVQLLHSLQPKIKSDTATILTDAQALGRALHGG